MPRPADYSPGRVVVPEIAPAVLAETPGQYRHDVDVAASVSDRIQIDLVDGEFADNKTINLVQTYWPEDTRADLHLMYHRPQEHVPTVISQHPHMAIIHVEARDVDEKIITEACSRLQNSGIAFGLAVLPDTPVSRLEPFVYAIDHVLVFTGELGHYGGQLRFDCLDKIDQVKRLNRNIEVGVDGGITEETAARVVEAGADVLNVGGFIQNATHPENAYATLKEIIDRSSKRV